MPPVVVDERALHSTPHPLRSNTTVSRKISDRPFLDKYGDIFLTVPITLVAMSYVGKKDVPGWTHANPLRNAPTKKSKPGKQRRCSAAAAVELIELTGGTARTNRRDRSMKTGGGGGNSPPPQNKFLLFTPCVYSLALCAILPLVAVCCYETSRPLVINQYTESSNSAARLLKSELEAAFEGHLVLTMQLAKLFGRHEGLDPAVNNYTTFRVGQEETFIRSRRLLNADMIYFGSKSNTFLGYGGTIAVKDTTTGQAYVKMEEAETLFSRNVSHVVSNITGFSPETRPWYVGAKSKYASFVKGGFQPGSLEAHWGDIYLAFGTTDKFMVSVSYPAVDAMTGEFLGVVASDILLSDIMPALRKAKLLVFGKAAPDGVFMAIVATTATGEHLLVGTTADIVQSEMVKLPMEKRSIDLATKLTSISDSVRKSLAALLADVSGQPLDQHIASRQQFHKSMGLKNWKLYAISPTSHVLAYGSRSAYATVVLLFVGIGLMFGTSKLLQARRTAAVRKLTSFIEILDTYFASRETCDTAKLGLKREELKGVEDVGVIVSLQHHEYAHVLITVGMAYLVMTLWFVQGEAHILGQVKTLVVSLTAEIKASVMAYLNVPLGLVNTMSLFYGMGVLPSQLNMSAAMVNRQDSGFIDMMTVYAVGKQPQYAYIGTERKSYAGVEMLRDGRVEVMAMDNTTLQPPCLLATGLQNFYVQPMGKTLFVRNASSAVPGKTFPVYDNRVRPWYTLPRKFNSSEPLWTPIYELITTPPTIAFSVVKKLTYNSEFFGVAGADYTLDQISILLARSMGSALKGLAGSVGSAYVVERDGMLVGTSSGVPITRVYSPNSSPQRVHATDICERREKYVEECDETISVSFREVEQRLPTNSLSMPFQPQFPNGLEIEVGKGAPTNAMFTRIVPIDHGYGLNWLLLCSFGKRSFVANFERLKDFYQLFVFAIVGFFVVLAYALSAARIRDMYGKSAKEPLEDADSAPVINVDSEEFFQHYRRILAPTVLSANLVARGNKNEPQRPRSFLAIETALRRNPDKTRSAFAVFDHNGTGVVSRDNFVVALGRLEYQVSSMDEDILFSALCTNEHGEIKYEALLEDFTLSESEATLAEKQRALEYIMLSRNVDVDVVDFLHLQRLGDTARIQGFRVYYSTPYYYFVVFSVLFNLTLSIFEAPASQHYHFTPNTVNLARPLIAALSVVSLLLYVVDVSFSVWLFGITQPSQADKLACLDEIEPKNHNINILFVCQGAILLSFLVDLALPAYTTGAANGDDASAQIVYLLPYTSLVRPLWPILRFSQLRKTLHAFVSTLIRAKAVFFLFFVTLVVFSIIGTSFLSNHHSYDVFDSFQSVYKSFSTLFIYMISAENYGEVVYPPINCDEMEIANTRNGGVQSVDCPKSMINMYTIFANLVGMFLIISLVIAVFEDVFSEYISQNRILDKIKSRLSLIAAFVILDKDGGGSLDKTEFINFLNSTCHTSRIFDVDDDFELSGADFIQLCEEFQHEMMLGPLPDIDEIQLRPNSYFVTCPPLELLDFLSNDLKMEHLPPLNVTDEDVLRYWRLRGADAYVERARIDIVKRAHNGLNRHSQWHAMREKIVFVCESELYQALMTAGLIFNVMMMALYGAVLPSAVPALDAFCITFVVLWFLEIMGRGVVGYGYKRFMRVNDDFFAEVRNRTDFFITVVAFMLLVGVALLRVSAGEPVFHPWEACTMDSCKPNDWARIALSFNALRLFGVFPSVHKIIYCFYVIVPNYSAIITLTALIMYFYAIVGCMIFGGTFKYLHEYDAPAANFNSLFDALLTLIQLFVGPAWNGVMGAGVDAVGSSAYVYFFSYVIISTLLLTNLLMGVIISGYGEIVEIQRDAEKRHVTKLPTKVITRALQEGRLGGQRLQFTYSAENHVAIAHAGTEEESRSVLEPPRQFDNISEDFKRAVECSRDPHKFYTDNTVTVVQHYGRLALKLIDDDASLKSQRKFRSLGP